MDMSKGKKGVIALESLAYGILIVAVVVIVGIYLIVQVGALIKPGSTDPNINNSVANVTFAFAQMAILLAVVVLVGVLAVIVAMLRGGFGGGARDGM